MEGAASIFVFLALVTGAFALFGTTRRGPGDRRVRQLSDRAGRDVSQAAVASLKRRHSSIPTLGRLLSNSSWADETALELQQANIQLRVGEYLLGRIGLAVLLFFVGLLLGRFGAVGLVIGLILGAAGYLVPSFIVKIMRGRRIAQIEKQLVEFAPMLASSLRSGFAFQQGVEMAAQQLGPPLATELSLLVNDINLGATMEAALLDLGRRVGSTDLDMMITAVIIQRTTGGNLAEILERAAETLRERERIRGDLNTLTAQPRLTATILSVYPIAVGLLLLAMMPSLWSVLFTETLGRVILGTALSLQALGFFTIRRLMNVEI